MTQLLGYGRSVYRRGQVDWPHQGTSPEALQRDAVKASGCLACAGGSAPSIRRRAHGRASGSLARRPRGRARAQACRCARAWHAGRRKRRQDRVRSHDRQRRHSAAQLATQGTVGDIDTSRSSMDAAIAATAPARNSAKDVAEMTTHWDIEAWCRGHTITRSRIVVGRPMIWPGRKRSQPPRARRPVLDRARIWMATRRARTGSYPC
jgi:hypothetical protein